MSQVIAANQYWLRLASFIIVLSSSIYPSLNFQKVIVPKLFLTPMPMKFDTHTHTQNFEQNLFWTTEKPVQHFYARCRHRTVRALTNKWLRLWCIRLATDWQVYMDIKDIYSIQFWTETNNIHKKIFLRFLSCFHSQIRWIRPLDVLRQRKDQNVFLFSHWFCKKCRVRLCITSKCYCFYEYYHELKKKQQKNQRRDCEQPDSSYATENQERNFPTQYDLHKYPFSDIFLLI